MNENDVEVKKDVENEEIRRKCLEVINEYDRLTKKRERKKIFDENFFKIIVFFNLVLAFLVIFRLLFPYVYDERCVKFYKENNYVLEGCEVYIDKMENSK